MLAGSRWYSGGHLPVLQLQSRGVLDHHPIIVELRNLGRVSDGLLNRLPGETRKFFLQLGRYVVDFVRLAASNTLSILSPDLFLVV